MLFKSIVDFVIVSISCFNILFLKKQEKIIFMFDVIIKNIKFVFYIGSNNI